MPIPGTAVNTWYGKVLSTNVDITSLSTYIDTVNDKYLVI